MADNPRWFWRQFVDMKMFCRAIGCTREELDQAQRESTFNYIEYDDKDRDSGRVRHICFPPKASILNQVQKAIRSRLLAFVEITPEIRGYCRGVRHIDVAAEICPYKYKGSVDISKYHPSIK